MKFKFKIQEYQTEAVDAVVKAFDGQPFNDKVSYMRDLGKQDTQVQQSLLEGDVGYIGYDESGFGNAPIELNDEQLLENIRSVQLENNIKQSKSLSKPFGKDCRCSLDIEMETGTGKTYCYIKTMFELNKKYGWSKFIVVVPSIAIREGVKKSFSIMEDHFFEHYGKKAQYFVYNSKNLNQLDSFSASKDIYVMIINAQAFNSGLGKVDLNQPLKKIYEWLAKNASSADSRKIFISDDKFGSRVPMQVLADTHPIIILDEPQKLGGVATQSSIRLFNPMFTLNYSATHRDTHNPIYVLDALDAYRKKLVKKIKVKGFELHNLKGENGFVYVSQILVEPNKPPRARIVFDMRRANSDIVRDQLILDVGANLYNLSAGRTGNKIEEYKNGFVIKDISKLSDTVTFLNGLTLGIGEANGDFSEIDMRRIQIRETILSHFEREERLFYNGIKCLSLFFIDEVAHYRQYDEGGNELLGDFGVMFEQEYTNIRNEYIARGQSQYIEYLKSIAVSDTHKGYFSIDKKTHRVVNSVEKRGACDDISAYELILKNKERLLSFDEPTRFIFSHSALREGWDNPNVFQICTLKQSNSAINKRQEVGRGMRLCVNRMGERMDSSVLGDRVHDINVLTIIASDSYKTFAIGLQNEIKDTLYERPTKATTEYFVGKVVRLADGTLCEITKEQAWDIQFYLISNAYIDKNGKVTNKFREAVLSGNIEELPDGLAAMSDGIKKLVQGIYDEKVLDDMIGNDNKPKTNENKLNKNFDKKEFQTLWNYINHIYTYTVTVDSDKLVESAINAIDEKMHVRQVRYSSTVGSQGAYSVEFAEECTKTSDLRNTGSSSVAYDLIGKICQGTTLTRKSVVRILKGIRPDVFIKFRESAEEFIAKTVKIINEQKAQMVVNAITYNVTEKKYDSDIFVGRGAIELNKNKVVEANRHITPYVLVDSNTERDFAKELEKHTEEVCVYAKLPHKFKIPTPVGDYTPDWAIAFYEGSVKHIYFVAETKGSEEHRDRIEEAKNNCARKLFEKLNSGLVRYEVVDSYKTLLDWMNK